MVHSLPKTKLNSLEARSTFFSMESESLQTYLENNSKPSLKKKEVHLLR